MMNRRIVLASRPLGEPKPENFRLEEVTVPELEKNQVLLKTIYLSLDPYMRGRMNDQASYASHVELNDVMVGGTIAKVAASKLEGFNEGDFVLSYSGWQDYAISDGTDLINLGKAPKHASYFLGVLGMPGFTAYAGLLNIGKPKSGETLVVAAASGPVGSVVGQIGKLKGCRVIGVAGGLEKCHFVTEELGFDACLDHHSPTFAEDLTDACADGIDIYFENVGGKIFDAVLPLFNTYARVPVCGLIASYNATKLPSGPDRLPLLMSTILIKSLTVRGFINSYFYNDYHSEFLKQMEEWLEKDKIKTREYVIDGLEKAPETFLTMLKGGNFGKTLVRVAEE